jgi:hypothetical protein
MASVDNVLSGVTMAILANKKECGKVKSYERKKMKK